MILTSVQWRQGGDMRRGFLRQDQVTCLLAEDHGQYLKRPRRIAMAVFGSFSMYCLGVH